MYATVQSHLSGKLAEIEQAGLFKREHLLQSPQKAEVRVSDGAEVLNLCANN